nr:TPA_asm: hypothetical protein [Planto tricladivirus]
MASNRQCNDQLFKNVPESEIHIGSHASVNYGVNRYGAWTECSPYYEHFVDSRPSEYYIDTPKNTVTVAPNGAQGDLQPSTSTADIGTGGVSTERPSTGEYGRTSAIPIDGDAQRIRNLAAFERCYSFNDVAAGRVPKPEWLRRDELAGQIPEVISAGRSADPRALYRIQRYITELQPDFAFWAQRYGWKSLATVDQLESWRKEYYTRLGQPDPRDGLCRSEFFASLYRDLFPVEKFTGKSAITIHPFGDKPRRTRHHKETAGVGGSKRESNPNANDDSDRSRESSVRQHESTSSGRAEASGDAEADGKVGEIDKRSRFGITSRSRVKVNLNKKASADDE